ncbi:MAG: methyltransferase, TIGR04325 family [Gemmatimonadaceae bacterium]|nr:methyltransferase, TIGR04325 family [Chitinophagaceae bacterium]
MIQTLKRLYLRLKYWKYGWFGNYPSWSAAQAECTGYNAGNILAKVRAAILKVKNGEAAWERDSVLSDKIEYSWPVLANILWIAQQNQNSLKILDFGGSLGSTFFQNRLYLKNLNSLTWDVVEQNEFVTTGQKEIAGHGLNFHYTIDEAVNASGLHNVFLISSALPYIEKPYDLINEITDKNFPYIIVDLTYFNPKPGDRITIQKVPPFYYDASYPAWFLDYDKVAAAFGNKYEMIAEFTNAEFLYLYGEKIDYRGFIMKLKN